MLVSILMEVRFEKSGMVRTRSFEVLPFQIYMAGESENEDVLYRSRLVLAFSIIRILCSLYILFIVYLKIRYNKVIGENWVGTVIKDLIQICLTITPVIIGYRLQNTLNLEDLGATAADMHELGRDA